MKETQQVSLFRLPKHILQDQAAIWTSPMKLRPRDAAWLVPASALSAVMFRTDADAVRYFDVRSTSASRSRQFSDVGVMALGATAGTMYLVGHWKDNPHAREAGLLSAEALANALALTYPLKYSLRRERPFVPGSNGDFFTSGGDSFPSTHATVSWALASVIAHEYPGWLTKFGVYGLATAVSFARVTGKQHFPSDVVIGSALGWGIGTFVYRKRHDPMLPGQYVDFSRPASLRGRKVPKGEVDPFSLASAPVELDSWAYPAIERLAALGMVNSDFAGMRPWTRMEAARLVDEAYASSLNREVTQDVYETIQRLKGEFGPELEVLHGLEYQPVVQLRTAYSRVTGTSGVPLTDGYHFGQTIYNDSGRVNREGVNFITGLAIEFTEGPWGAFLQGEFQHAPNGPAPSPAVQKHISLVDFAPIQPSAPLPQIDRFRLLSTFGAYTWKGWQFSFGRQSLWWSPAESGALLFSDNAEPINMIRLSRVTPLKGLTLFRPLGRINTELFLGQVSGQQMVFVQGTNYGPPLSRQPMILGGKFSMRPTSNVEFSVSFTNLFAGPGVPFNGRTFLRALGLSNTVPGQASDPGDRRSGVDFRYRVPGLRDRLTVYLDSFAEDEISPLAFPRRSAFILGFYLPRVPFTKKLDFRGEGVYTDLPGLQKVGFFYANNHYLNGYTDQGNLIGHWVGRQGSGFQLQSTYWVAPDRFIRGTFRHAAVSEQFLPGGGKVQDYGIQCGWNITRQWQVNSRMMVERWKMPLLAPSAELNVTSQVEVRFNPLKPFFRRDNPSR